MSYIDSIKKAEGVYYGDGAAMLIQRVVDAVKGKSKAKDQAEAAYGAVRQFAEEIGMNPKSECLIRSPAKNKAFGYGDCYCVSFEAGPYEWAIPCSMALGDIGVFCEPYYSFDLCFYPSEDSA